MFFKTTISSISNTNPLFNFSKNNATEYVFNVRYLSNIVSYGLGSSFVLINDYDRRGKDVYFSCSTSVADVKAEFDILEPNDYYTLHYFKNDNPAKDILIKDIPTDYIISLFKYWNPSYTWLVFDSYNDYRRVLINDTLDNILAVLTTEVVTTTEEPSNILLNEDGTPILNYDGSYIYTS